MHQAILGSRDYSRNGVRLHWNLVSVAEPYSSAVNNSLPPGIGHTPIPAKRKSVFKDVVTFLQI